MGIYLPQIIITYIFKGASAQCPVMAAGIGAPL